MGGFNGRRVELAEYMKKIENTEKTIKNINSTIEELKTEKVSTSLLAIADPTNSKGTFNTLFDFVNSKNLKKICDESSSNYQNLEVC